MELIRMSNFAQSDAQVIDYHAFKVVTLKRNTLYRVPHLFWKHLEAK